MTCTYLYRMHSYISVAYPRFRNGGGSTFLDKSRPVKRFQLSCIRLNLIYCLPRPKLLGGFSRIPRKEGTGLPSGYADDHSMILLSPSLFRLDGEGPLCQFPKATMSTVSFHSFMMVEGQASPNCCSHESLGLPAVGILHL